MNPPLRQDHRLVLRWLIACAVLVACMVMLGGYTRLSGSGLSITTWKPLHGTIPPLSLAAWEEEFTAYRESPQFQKVNYAMTLEEFKSIFWPEYLHRLLGRAIGFAFLLPFIYFLWRGSFAPRFAIRLFCIFALGGLQGLVGWLMVKSGLVNEPRVSHLRLAAHLAMAFLIFALILWAALEVAWGRARWHVLPPGCLNGYRFWFFLLCAQIVFGAFMAGLHAGLVYNTWPDMNGAWIPADIFFMSPWFVDVVANIATVQFIHRTLAVFVVLGFVLWWCLCRLYVKKLGLSRLCAALAAMLAVQFLLGVFTLLHMVPLPLAWLHQLTGLVLFAAGTMLLYRLSAAKYAERHASPQ